MGECYHSYLFGIHGIYQVVREPPQCLPAYSRSDFLASFRVLSNLTERSLDLYKQVQAQTWLTRLVVTHRLRDLGIRIGV